MAFFLRPMILFYRLEDIRLHILDHLDSRCTFVFLHTPYTGGGSAFFVFFLKEEELKQRAPGWFPRRKEKQK